MAINFIVFDSIPSLKKYVEQAIADTKTAMGMQMKSIDEVKRRMAKAASRHVSPANTTRKDIAGFKVLLNPTVDHELKLMEETFSGLQERLEIFEDTKELFPHITEQNLKIGLVLEDGLPSAFVFNIGKDQ